MLTLKKLWVGIAFFLSIIPFLEAGYEREELLIQFFDEEVLLAALSEDDRTTAVAARSYLHVCDFWLHIEAVLSYARAASCLQAVIGAAQGQELSESYWTIVLGRLFRLPKYVYCGGAKKWPKRAQSRILAGYDVPVQLAQVLAAEDPVGVAQAIVKSLDPARGHHLLAGVRLSLMERYPRAFLERMERELNAPNHQPNRGRDINLRGAAGSAWGSDVPHARL